MIELVLDQIWIYKIEYIDYIFKIYNLMILIINLVNNVMILLYIFVKIEFLLCWVVILRFLPSGYWIYLYWCCR
jgi:hypothetical protein